MNPRILKLLLWMCLAFIWLPAFSQNGVIRVKQFATNIDNNFDHIFKATDNTYIVHESFDADPGGISAILKLDSNFNQVWKISISNIQKVNIAPTSDGGVIACGGEYAGATNSTDVWVERWDKDGNMIFQKWYGGHGTDIGVSIKQRANGNFLVAGITNSTDLDVLNRTTTENDIWLFEINPSGTLVNQHVYGSTGGEGYFAQLDITSDNGVILASETSSTTGLMVGNHGSADLWVAKLDANFAVQWSICIGGTSDELPTSVYQDAAGNYIVGGQTFSSDGDFPGPANPSDGFVVKLDASGNKTWIKVIGGTWTDMVNKALPLPDNSIIISGETQSDNIPGVARPTVLKDWDAFGMKLSPNGDIIWARRIGSSSLDQGYDVVPSISNLSYVFTGNKFYNSNDGDFATVIGTIGEQQAFILELSELNTIKGIVFNDQNNNQIVDAGETYYNAALVDTKNSSYELTSQPVNGSFLSSVGSGQYITRLKYQGLIDTTNFGISPKRRISTFNGGGQTDSFSIRIVPAAIIKDLGVSITQLNTAFLNNTVKLRIRYTNAGGLPVDTAFIKLVFDNKEDFVSATKPIFANSSDTVTWRFIPLAAHFKDSMDVTIRIRSLPTVRPGDVMNLLTIAEPYFTDFDSTDNIATLSSPIAGQNSAISNLSFQVSIPDSARLNRTIPYIFTYNFSSLLDSTNGLVRIVKDHHTSFVSSIPAPTSQVNDTLAWNFTNLKFGNTDTISLNLKVDTGTGLTVGSHILHAANLVMLTADTLPLSRSILINQGISGSFIQPDTVTTTLRPPHGIRWTRSFGGSGLDVFNDVVALPDSGFIAVGQTTSTDGDIHITGTNPIAIIVRFNKDGQLIWKTFYVGRFEAGLSSVSNSSDGFFYSCGYTFSAATDYSNALVIKFSIDGSISWVKSLGNNNGTESSSSIIGTSDGGCIFAGMANAGGGDVHGYIAVGSQNIWTVKLDGTGNVLWDKCNVFQNLPTAGNCIKETLDHNYIIGGYIVRYIGAFYNPDGALMLLDNSGNQLWAKRINDNNLSHVVESIVVNSDNTFTFAGTAGILGGVDTSFSGLHGFNEAWVAKVDNSGNNIWQKFFGGSNLDEAHHIEIASDGSYLVAGETQSGNGNVTNQHNGSISDGWLLNVGVEGQLIWQKTIGGTGSDIFMSVAELKDQSLIAVGTTTSNDGDINGFHGGQSDALLAKIGVANFISGSIYYDKNGNGAQDPGEPFFNNGIINATNSIRTYATVPTNGQYFLTVDTGSYSVKFITADTSYFTTVPDPATTTLNQYGISETINFRRLKKGDIQDLAISLLPHSIPIAGHNYTYTIKYENRGTIDVSAVTVKVVIDPKTQYVSSSIPYSSNNNDTLEWDLPGIGSLASGTFDLVLLAGRPPQVVGGTILTITAQVLPILGDTTPTNNKAVDHARVSNSYDPNDKIEVHGDSYPYLPNQDNEYLTYMVRFQNTGTAPAINVYVRDTLAANLDWNSFEMILGSHPYSLSITDGNKLEWTFNDINLPDSNFNEPASHGYIAFRIKPKQNLSLSDTIKNIAGIYFDFNLPVATNLAKTSLISVELPSTILQFSAKWSGKNPQLTWDVVNEYNVKQYVIEYSNNGVDFNDVGAVPAQNVSNRHQYNFLDAERTAGLNYYRLRVVDIDNKVSYSKVLLLRSTTTSNPLLVIYPNPTNGLANISLKGAIQGSVSITITGLDGKIIGKKLYGSLNQTDFKTTLNLGGLSKGTYVIECKVGDITYKNKVLVQ